MQSVFSLGASTQSPYGINSVNLPNPDTHNDHVSLRRQSAVRRQPLDSPRSSGISLLPQDLSAHPQLHQCPNCKLATHHNSSEGALTPRAQTRHSSSSTSSSDSHDSEAEPTLSSISREALDEVGFDLTPHGTQGLASVQADQCEGCATTMEVDKPMQPAEDVCLSLDPSSASPVYVSTTAASPTSYRGEDKLSAPHAFSSAALYHVGLVEGITPPAMLNTTGIPHQSSVVATGLEMGLGVSLASSALRNHAAGVGTAMSGLAEPRFSRSHQDTYDTQYIYADGPHSPTSSDHQSPHSVVNGPASNSRDSELHRRRTTGTRPLKQRFEPNRGIRHHRADTHDTLPVNTHASTTAELEKQQYIQNNYIALRNDPKSMTSAVPDGRAIDDQSSASVSLGRNSSIGGHSSTNANIGSTAPATPSVGDKAGLSPDLQLHQSANPFPFHGHESGRQAERAGWKSAQKGTYAAGSGPTQAALLGLGGGSHFGPGVRAKVSEVLPYLVSSVPLSGEPGENVTIAEYGSLNTRSINLMQPIISSFVDKAHSDAMKRMDGDNDEEIDDDGEGHPPSQSLDGATSLLSYLSVNSASEQACKVTFSVIHEDSPQADFRPLSHTLDSSFESYLNPQWQSTHQPSLQNVVFPSFVARPFASRIAPPSSVYLGISLMDLHWSHTPRNSAVSLSTSAHAELTAFLNARAHEFRKDGVFVMAYIARAEDSNVVVSDRPKSTLYTSNPKEAKGDMGDEKVALASSESHSKYASHLQEQRTRFKSSPDRPILATVGADSADPTLGGSDIWTTMTNTLAPCLQRLVSCGMLKSEIARHLLSLPMHARTPRQTRNVLKSVRHLWKVEWSCGLGDEAIGSEASSDGQAHLMSESEPLRLPHPAWKALQAGTLSRVAFAEHMIQLFKNLYESHFRVILREKGKLSKGAVEFVLDSLWDVLQSRIDDQEPCPIAQCELEVQVVALRRT